DALPCAVGKPLTGEVWMPVRKARRRTARRQRLNRVSALRCALGNALGRALGNALGRALSRAEGEAHRQAHCCECATNVRRSHCLQSWISPTCRITPSENFNVPAAAAFGLPVFDRQPLIHTSLSMLSRNTCRAVPFRRKVTGEYAWNDHCSTFPFSFTSTKKYGCGFCQSNL